MGLKVNEQNVHGTEVVFIGVSHYMGQNVQDKLIEYKPDYICAESEPDVGFTRTADQKAISSYLNFSGAHVTMMDEIAFSWQEYDDPIKEKFGEETETQISNAESRSDIEEICPDFYQTMFEDRERVMKKRIRKTVSMAGNNETVVVVVGSMHMEGLVDIF